MTGIVGILTCGIKLFLDGIVQRATSLTIHARIQFRFYVAGRRVNVVPPLPYASTLTRRPAPGSGFVGFGVGQSRNAK